MCAKELQDDLEVVRFRYRIGASEAVRNARNHVERQGDLLEPFRALARFLGERRARKVFARRTRTEIEAWRLRAGILGRAG